MQIASCDCWVCVAKNKMIKLVLYNSNLIAICVCIMSLETAGRKLEATCLIVSLYPKLKVRSNLYHCIIDCQDNSSSVCPQQGGTKCLYKMLQYSILSLSGQETHQTV